ncbi:MAG: hypothetical protein ACI8RZ_000975 [Myxococcota bacterium]|jgi:uncharacterized protein YggT (Ycf19 family)
MSQDNLVWDSKEEATSFNRLDKSIQEQSDREREELLELHREKRKLSILQSLVSVPFWIVYAMIFTRMVFDSLNSWSLREEHQMVVSVTEPLLGRFMEIAVVEMGLGLSINPSHLLAIATIIVIHLFMTGIARVLLR